MDVEYLLASVLEHPKSLNRRMKYDKSACSSISPQISASAVEEIVMDIDTRHRNVSLALQITSGSRCRSGARTVIPLASGPQESDVSNHRH